MSNNDNAAQGEKKQEEGMFQKGMTLDRLNDRFGKKIETARSKAFEQKFEAEYKKLADAQAIVDGLNKTLEKMWVEFNEGL